jgi:hypothetical protein
MSRGAPDGKAGEWESRADTLARAGLAALMPVRLLVPASVPRSVIASVPAERVLPDLASLLSEDPQVAVFDELLSAAPAIESTLGSARLHPRDLVIFPEAGPAELLGAARWLLAQPVAAPALVFGLVPRSVGFRGAEPEGLYRALASLFRRLVPRRFLFFAEGEDARWFEGAGMPGVVEGNLGRPEGAAVADLIPVPSRLAPARSGRPAARAGAASADVVRSLGLPAGLPTVVMWGSDAIDGALRALSSLPWASTLMCVLVGARPLEQLPFQVASFEVPESGDETSLLAALGELHLFTGSEPSLETMRAVASEGRPILCEAAAGATLDEAEDGSELVLGTYEEMNLTRRLAGLLLQPDALWRFAGHLRTRTSEPECVSA